MADKELVIRLDEETYDAVCEGQAFGQLYLNTLRKICDAIQNGILLPKGHGRLIDADVFIDGFEDYYELCELVNSTPTIIKADKEYEAEVITRGNCMMCGKKLDEGLFFCKECEARAGDDMTENEKNKKYAEKLLELILSNPTLRVVVMIDTDGIDDDYGYKVGNLYKPRIETIAVNHDNIYFIKQGDDYDDCYSYYGWECDDWTDETLADKAKAIPWEEVIAVEVSAL